jgi:hypothetical protein
VTATPKASSNKYKNKTKTKSISSNGHTGCKSNRKTLAATIIALCPRSPVKPNNRGTRCSCPRRRINRPSHRVMTLSSSTSASASSSTPAEVRHSHPAQPLGAAVAHSQAHVLDQGPTGYDLKLTHSHLTQDHTSVVDDTYHSTHDSHPRSDMPPPPWTVHSAAQSNFYIADIDHPSPAYSPSARCSVSREWTCIRSRSHNTDPDY